MVHAKFASTLILLATLTIAGAARTQNPPPPFDHSSNRRHLPYVALLACVKD